jgi:hypothetical protein
MFTKEVSVFRPIGEIGGGAIPTALVGLIALLLVMFRYISFNLGLSARNVTKEVPMLKTTIVKTRLICSAVLETIWAIGSSSVAAHLST